MRNVFTLKEVSPLLLNVFSLFSGRPVREIERDSQLANLRRELEATRYHLREMIKEHNKAAREMNKALEAVSHELRNPLAALIYGIELLRQDGKAGIKHLTRMERQINKLARLADNLPNIPNLQAAEPRPINHASHPLLYLRGTESQSDSVDETSAAS